MKFHAHLVRLAGVTLLAAFALQHSANDAMAAKEKFERTKPHVNVGNTGPAENPTDLAAPQGGGASDSNSAPGDCSPDQSSSSKRPAC